MSAGPCTRPGCPHTATARVLWFVRGGTSGGETRLCAIDLLVAHKFADAFGLVMKIEALPCSSCGYEIDPDDRANTEEPLHLDCVDKWNTRPKETT